MSVNQGELIYDIVPLMMKTKRFQSLTKEQCSDYVRPFCEAGQVVVARSEQGDVKGDIFGFAFCASTDDATATRLKSPDLDMIDVGLNGLGKGPHPWFVEVVCNPTVVDVFLKTSAASVFPEQTVTVRLLDNEGQVKTVRVSPEASKS